MQKRKTIDTIIESRHTQGEVKSDNSILVVGTFALPWDEQVMKVANHLAGVQVRIVDHGFRYTHIRDWVEDSQPIAVNVDAVSDCIVLVQGEAQTVANHLKSVRRNC